VSSTPLPRAVIEALPSRYEAATARVNSVLLLPPGWEGGLSNRRETMTAYWKGLGITFGEMQDGPEGVVAAIEAPRGRGLLLVEYCEPESTIIQIIGKVGRPRERKRLVEYLKPSCSWLVILHTPAPEQWATSIIPGPEMTDSCADLYRQLVENPLMYPTRCAATARAATGSPTEGESHDPGQAV
jgi:hypothetical protein